MGCAFGTAGESQIVAAAAAQTGTTGCDLVSGVTTEAPYEQGSGPLRVVAYDFGVKETALRLLGELATVTVVPASFPAARTLELEPDGIFLSNGPGDPAALGALSETISRAAREDTHLRRLSRPSVARCGPRGPNLKAHFGHHGGNHPVRRLGTARIEVTSHNHNYAVEETSLPHTGSAATEVTHVNLNDGVVEGLRCQALSAFGVQYHPEAGPGPHDSRYLFQQFRLLMEKGV